MSKKIIAMDSQILTTLMACPRLADFRFNRDLVSKGGKAPALETGSLVHVIFEWFNKSIIEGKSRNESISIGYEAGQEYIKPFSPINKFIKDESHLGIQSVPYESDDKRVTSISDVLHTIELYFDYWKNDSYKIIAAEQTRGEIIYEDDDIKVLWKAKFDNILDMPVGIISRDYKTMKVRRDTVKLNNQFMGHCVLLKSRHVMIDKVGFQKSLPAQERFVRELKTYTLDNLLEWQNETIPYYANMLASYAEADNYPANLTHCENKYGKCAFIDVCETDRTVREDVIKVYFDVGKKWDVLNDD